MILTVSHGFYASSHNPKYTPLITQLRELDEKLISAFKNIFKS